MKRFVIAAVVLLLGLHAGGVENIMAKTPELFDSGVPRGQSQILARYFEDASKRLQGIVLRPVGRTASSREFRSARAAEQVQQIDAIIAGLKARSSGWVGKRIPAAYRDGLRRAAAQAKEAGVRVDDSAMSGSFSLVDQRTAAIFARDAAADLSRAADSLGARAASVLRRTAQIGLAEGDIDRILAGGAIEGQPVQTIRELREALRAVHGDRVSIVDKNGDPMEFNVGHYAEMVARTKTRQATVTARHGRLEELGLDLVSIVGRVSPYFCTAFLGQVFSLSGTSAKYPAYSELPGGGPPFHPNCSKSTRPFVEELAGDRQLRDAEPLDDARTLLGMDVTRAQRAFKDLQLQSQVRDRYATTEKKLFG